MKQEKYIGMDVHHATIAVAVRDSMGKLIMECIQRVLQNDGSAARDERVLPFLGAESLTIAKVCRLCST
jgi:hypothetical protein